MYNGNYPNDFEENQTGSTGNSAGNGQEQQPDNRTGYAYHNYYDERYRGGQDRDRQSYGSAGSGYDNGGTGGGYGNGGTGGGYDNGGTGRHNGRKPKKNKTGRIIAAVALIVVFVGFCAGISWLAVESIQSQLASAQVEESTAEEEWADQEQFAKEDGADAGEEMPADEGAIPKSEPAAGDQIASAAPVEETWNGTVVVTDVTEVVEKVMPACVSITNSYTEQIQDFWGQTYSQDEEASGSGIIIGQNDSELLIVTNNHVVTGANTLSVQFIDGANVEAQVKGTDAAVDLAVVAVNLDDIDEETKNEICIAQMGDSDHLKIGEPAIAIGNALGYGQSVTTGVISALNRTLEVSETGTSNALIQTDAAINPGNSGGALLNIRGEVVGINSSKIGASVVEGMGYAIPISTAKPIIEELMTHETRSRVKDEERGYLGISCINVTSDLSENFNMPEGIFVAQVYEGTGADKAGLVRGDIITEFDGTVVKTQDELTRQMGYYKAGQTVEITIMQGSPTGYQAKKVQITLSSYEELSEASSRQQEAEQKSDRRQLIP